MAEIRCPNCGKMNPDDQDYCKFCQAELKPLESSTPFTNEPSGETSEPDEDLPDWLRGLRGLDEGGSEGAAKGEETPDWFQGTSFSETEETKDGAAPEAPDWLTRLEGHEEQKAEPGEASAPPAGEGLPEWLVEPKAGEVPEWFPTEGPEQPGSVGQPLSEEPVQPAQPTPEEALPDWFAEFKANQDQALSENAAPAEPAKEEPAASPFQSSSDLPDWLSDLSTQEPPVEEARPPEQAETLLSLGKQAASEPSTPSTPAFDESNLTGLGADEVLPDWLKKLETSSPDTLATGVPALILGDESYQPEETGTGELTGAENLPSEPDWLSQVSAEPQATPETKEPAQEADLAKATLPGWLEAMRPVEPVESGVPFKDTSDERVEGAGPLAGLKGILSAEAGAAQVRKPAIFSIKLQVPTDQQGRLDMLMNLVEGEAKVKPLPAPAAVSISSIVRLALFVILVLAVIWALSGPSIMPVPAVQPGVNAISSFHAAVDALPAKAQVLMSFDYDPGFSGELEASITAVLSHLAQKGASVVAVSTNTNGPYLAERMIQGFNSQPVLAAPISYIDLGYIPGGTTGLAAFANSPSQLMQYDLKDGKSPWNGNPLDFRSEFQNFSMVIVITENADTARTWIEQVGPILQSGAGPIPLLMIVSAQADPMVNPYYQGSSPQVAGILSGLRAGVIYENLVGQSGAAHQYWDAYSLTIVASVLLIVIGVCVSGILNALARYRRNDKAEGKA